MIFCLAAVVAVVASDCQAQGLQFLADYEDDDDLAGGIDGLQAVSSVALSPDGTSLYAIGTLEDSIALFERDPATGLLTFVTAYFDDDSPSPNAAAVNLGLNSTRDVVVSPDGKHVYATGLLDQAVGVFARNPATGALALVEVEIDPVNLRGAFGIVVSPDGSHAYVASRTNDSVTSFARDSGSGALSLIDTDKNGLGGVTGLDSAEGIAISPDGKHVYTAAGSDINFTGSDAIGVFARVTQSGSPDFGKLTFVESLTEGGSDGSGNTVDGLNEVSRLVVSPDGQHVYSTSNVDSSDDPDWIAVFSRNAQTGRLTFIESHGGPPEAPFELFCFGVIGDCGVAVHPDGTLVYACNVNGVGVFLRDPASGRLTFSELECGYFGFGISTTEEVVVSADGQDVYTAEFPFGLAAFSTSAPSYDSWASGFPGFVIGPPGSDSDLDGIPNLIEFTFDLDPTAPQPGAAEARLPSPELEGDRLVVGFKLPFPAREDLLIEVLAASDLTNPQVIATRSGSGDWTGPATVTEGEPFNTRSVRVSDTTTSTQAGARYIWIRVTQIAP